MTMTIQSAAMTAEQIAKFKFALYNISGGDFDATDEEAAALLVIAELAACPVTPAPDEAVAKAIYIQWAYKPSFVPWVDGGNSMMQDKARRLASQALSASAPEARHMTADEREVFRQAIADSAEVVHRGRHASAPEALGMDAAWVVELVPESVLAEVFATRSHRVADDLARYISEITGADIGEHSSGNDPWANACDAARGYLQQRPDAGAPEALADKIIAAYKEHYDFPPQGESHMHDCISMELDSLAAPHVAPPAMVKLECPECFGDGYICQSDGSHRMCTYCVSPPASAPEALKGPDLFALARKCAGSTHTMDCLTMNAADFDNLAAALAAPSTPAAEVEPTFVNVYCSQCGRDFGPGEHGFSHCRNHAGKASK